VRLKLHPSTKLNEGDNILMELPAASCRALLS
jgi:hypothetical protein